MIAYIARRLILSLFTIVMISMLAFFIIELPEGDLATKRYDRTTAYTSGDAQATEIMVALREYLQLDRPIYVRYAYWIWNMFRHGDLGRSFGPTGHGLAVQVSVKQVIGGPHMDDHRPHRLYHHGDLDPRHPHRQYSAVRQHSVGDYLFTFMGFTGLAVPDFLLGLVLLYIGYAYFDQSVGGLFSADYQNAPWSVAKALDMIEHLWIPAIVLGTSGTASLIRIMRNNLLDELGKPYVVTARAKGVGRIRIILKYPVRVALNPLISTIGYLLPALVSGSVIVSVVLSLPTIGPVLLTAIQDEDIYLAGFVVLLIGMLTVFGTLLSDILLAVIDPRIKFSGN